MQVALKKMLMKDIRLHKEICKFLEEELVYLGYVINSYGVGPSPEKLVIKAPIPKLMTELLWQFSADLQPLYKLLKHSAKWE